MNGRTPQSKGSLNKGQEDKFIKTRRNHGEAKYAWFPCLHVETMRDGIEEESNQSILEASHPPPPPPAARGANAQANMQFLLKMKEAKVSTFVLLKAQVQFGRLFFNSIPPAPLPISRQAKTGGQAAPTAVAPVTVPPPVMETAAPIKSTVEYVIMRDLSCSHRR